MANEITATLTVRVKNGAFNQVLTFNSTFDQATLGGGGPGMIDIGTSEENIALGDITTPSLCVFQSLEAKGGNYVDVGVSATTPTMAVMQRVFASQFGMLWLFPTATIRAQANTAAVRMMFWVFEV